MQRTFQIFCIAILLCMSALAAPVAAATLIVAADGSGDYTSVKAAVDAAEQGDTVYIKSGRYSESTQITASNPDITIRVIGDEEVLSTVTVTPTEADLTAGETLAFSAGASTQYGERLTETTFTWFSSDEAIGTIDAAGLFTALGAGTTTVTAAAGNVNGTAQVTVTGGDAPVADFTSDASSGRVPLTVSFTDTSTGDATSWSWDFGDGATSTEQNPTHTYVAAGTFTVTLTATGPGGSDIKTKENLITVSPPLTADNYNGGIPLTTAQNGTVSGGLWYDAYPGFATSAEKTFTLPEHTNIAWARLYVNVYLGHMQNNYRGNVTINIDADGNEIYEIQKHETLSSTYSFPGQGGTGPVWLNDHMNRVTSDYLMWYDLTDAITGRTVNVQAATEKIDSSFDGRIKAMVLVVAYDDGDTDEVHYWVNQGHDTVNPLDDVYTGSTTFDTSVLAGGWHSADLSAIYLASTDGAYTFQGTPLTSGTGYGPYFGSNTWDVTSVLTPGQDSMLGYDKSGSNYYKIPLALLSVRYGGSSGGAAPVLTTIEVSPATANLAVDATQQFTATAKDQDGGEITGVSFTWSSGNETVGTVNATGYFTALAIGTTTVTASADGVTGSATVTVGVPTCDLTVGLTYPTGNAVFAREPNRIRVMNIKNNGPETSPETELEVQASDGFVGRTAVPSLTSGQTVILFLEDPTIREYEGGTVTYTAVVDPDNTVLETDETNNVKVGAAKPVRYNGYKGKMYWEGGSNVTTVRTYDLRGDIIHSFGNSQYMSGSFGSEGWTNYTVTWTGDDLPLPAGATVRDAWLYVPYCWDNSNLAPDHVSIDFNGVRVPYENWYHDRANFGAYANHVYGLMTYNVTDLYEAGVNNTAFFARESTGAISPAGFTLAVVYEDASATRKQIFVNEEFDLLGADQDNYGTNMTEATAYVPFTGMTIDTDDVVRANLTTFVPWGNDGEGNLYFNGEQIGTGVWNYGPRAVGASDSTQVGVDEREVTAYLNATGNEAAIQGDNTWKSPCMVAAQTFLVVEYGGGSGGDAPDLVVSTLASNNGEVFSAAENIYTAKITNIGTADAGAFAVEFNASSATGTVAVDGLAAGANTTVTWTDETIRNAGDAVTITAVADPDGLIGESNEENNLLSIERTVVHNGYRGKRWTDGEDIATAKTYDVRGDLLWSAGDGAYLSAGTNWADYTVNWTASDLTVPEGATIAGARLYVPYTYDKGPVFPENVALTFNGAAVEQAAFYEDEKGWGTSYPYGMVVYDVTDAFSAEGNTALLTNTFPGGGNVSVRGMLLAVVYDDGVTAPHTVLMNEGFDLLYGGASQSTTPKEATAYAPFTLDPANATGARLVTVAPGAGPNEGELIFNGETWTNVWNYTGTSQIGVDERNVTSLLAGENVAAFQSSADYMEAAAAFLIVEYAPEPGSILVTSTPTGAAVWLDGEDTGQVTPITLTNVPAGDHVVTVKLDGYADASMPVTVATGETAEVDLELTTLTGSLTVTSTPEGAAILIDGADTGEVTNATLDGIAVGTHTVTLKKDGYADTTADVTVAYNETAALHLDLVEARGSIAVASTPTGAAIWLDGIDTGMTTNAILENVAAGEHTVTVKKAGYADASATVAVADDEIATVSFTLTAPAGSIVVTSAPDGARIVLDGAETGETTNATLTNVPVGTHTVRVELDGYLETEETVTVASGEIASVHFDLDAAAITLQPGWNFVSTPKQLADGQDTIAIFDGVDTAGRPVLLYNGTSQWEAMSREEAFRPLDGVWIYANTSYTIPLVFAAGSISTPPTKDLDEGWNAIGFSDTVPETAANTLRSVEPAWAMLFGWKANEQAYDVSIIRGATGRHGETRELFPTQGYWLYMNDADTLAAIGA